MSNCQVAILSCNLTCTNWTFSNPKSIFAPFFPLVTTPLTFPPNLLPAPSRNLISSQQILRRWHIFSRKLRNIGNILLQPNFSNNIRKNSKLFTKNKVETIPRKIQSILFKVTNRITLNPIPQLFNHSNPIAISHKIKNSNLLLPKNLPKSPTELLKENSFRISTPQKHNQLNIRNIFPFIKLINRNKILDLTIFKLLKRFLIFLKRFPRMTNSRTRNIFLKIISMKFILTKYHSLLIILHNLRSNIIIPFTNKDSLIQLLNRNLLSILQNSFSHLPKSRRIQIIRNNPIINTSQPTPSNRHLQRIIHNLSTKNIPNILPIHSIRSSSNTKQIPRFKII